MRCTDFCGKCGDVQIPQALSTGPIGDVVAEATGREARHDPVLPGTGGPAGNAVLTAWTGTRPPRPGGRGAAHAVRRPRPDLVARRRGGAAGAAGAAQDRQHRVAVGALLPRSPALRGRRAAGPAAPPARSARRHLDAGPARHRCRCSSCSERRPDAASWSPCSGSGSTGSRCTRGRSWSGRARPGCTCWPAWCRRSGSPSPSAAAVGCRVARPARSPSASPWSSPRSWPSCW